MSDSTSPHRQPSVNELVELAASLDENPTTRLRLEQGYEFFKAAVDAGLVGAQVHQDTFAYVLGEAVRQGLMGFRSQGAGAILAPDGAMWSSSELQSRFGYHLTADGQQVVTAIQTRRAAISSGRVAEQSTYWHVIVTPTKAAREGGLHEEVVLGKDEQWMRDRILDRRDRGELPTIGGRSWSWDEIQKIEITVSDETPDQLIARARADGRLALGLTPEWAAARLGRDITDDLIDGPPGKLAASPPSASSSKQGHPEIFLVHGADHGSKEAVARFLEKTGTHPVVILHEQPNEGRTLIEKLEAHASQADYAVILLTADDVGGPAPGEDLQPRARQNVVFEFGLFCGSIRRKRVCVLYDPRVELPSDIDGLAYIALDESGAWRGALVKELNAAGLDFDANRA